VAVILATGVSTVPPRVSMQSGVLAYLVKPFTRADALQALRQALEWHAKTVASGPNPHDTADRLKTWLEELDV
jgi:FixJ family two-component response regulator